MKGWPIPAGVGGCLDTLRRTGHAAYPVGGCVRDLLLGRTPGDFDVCTDARPERVMELFPHTVPTGLRHGTVTVRTEDGPVEVTTFRREAGYADGRHPDAVDFDATLAEDLARRDFTVNAMALDENGMVIDRYGGQMDLFRNVIRCVGDPDRRFAEDALRMLRAVRFAAQLGFSIEKGTLDAIRRSARRPPTTWHTRRTSPRRGCWPGPGRSRAGRRGGHFRLDRQERRPPGISIRDEEGRPWNGAESGRACWKRRRRYLICRGTWWRACPALS